MLFIALWVQMSGLKKNEASQIENYISSTKQIVSIMSKYDIDEARKRVEMLGFDIVEDVDTADKKSLFRREMTLSDIEIFKIGKKYYLSISYLDNEILLYDKAQDQAIRDRSITYLLFFVDIALLVTIYFLVIRIISPLRDIGNTMQKFAGGDMDCRAIYRSNDEIGEVAKSFNAMANKLQKTIKSKEELMRDIGHELKTPIAKGRFAVEALPDGKSKQILSQTLDELETLTEKILQSKLIDEDILNISCFKASTLIADALSKLVVQESDVVVELDDFDIHGDLYYISIALKNLVENGLKHGQDTPVTIKAGDGKISVCSTGEPLPESMAYYIKAFTRGGQNTPGHGLGLNIVKKILDKHGFELHYFYKSGYNCFRITFHKDRTL